MSEEEKKFLAVNVQRLDGNITMLRTYLGEEDISHFLSALEELKDEPESEVAMRKVVAVFEELGIVQGAVLNYATYLKVLIPNIKNLLKGLEPLN